MSARATFWLSFALMLAGVAGIVFWAAPRIDAGGLAPFDTRTAGYSYADALAFLEALSPEGRAVYLGPERLADTVFPIGFLGVLALGSYLALRRWSAGLGAVAALVALVYFIFDMLENAAVAGLLKTAPEEVTPEAVARASLFTVWKFHFVNAALVILVLGWSARGIDWMLHKRRGR